MSVTTPRVSVIMPTYNYGRYVADAIESIQAQTFGNFEIVVVDDGSTDDTAAILARLAEPRLKVIRQERAGTASARNRGLEAARGEFITWLDADDLWKPTFLERHLAVLEAEPEVGYSFSNFMRSRDGVPLPGTQFDLVPRLRQLPTRAARGASPVSSRWMLLPPWPPVPLFPVGFRRASSAAPPWKDAGATHASRPRRTCSSCCRCMPAAPG